VICAQHLVTFRLQYKGMREWRPYSHDKGVAGMRPEQRSE